MALQNSFDSKVNREFRLTTVLLEIKKSHLVNTPHSEGSDIIFVTDADTEVSSFQHPIYDADADVVYLDVRGYSILDRNGAFRLKGDLDSDLLLLRGKLELAWMHATANDLFTALGYSNEVFVRWLSETITQQFSLNPAQDTQLKVLIALYNIGQYYNNITEPALITRYYRLISQQYYIDMQTVEEIASRLTQTFPRDLSEFIAAVKEANISTRLSALNEVSMYNMLGGAWFFTANPGAVVGLALEYPPAFAAMVAMAVNFRVFKKTKIGGVVERTSRRDAHGNYIRALKHLFDRTVGEPKPGKYKGGYGLEQFPINVMAAPDFDVPAIGSEGADWGRILTAIGAGSAAGLLTYGLIKFIQWITGGSSGGGGGGSSVDEQISKIQQETNEIIKRSNESIAEAYKKQAGIVQQHKSTFDALDEVFKRHTDGLAARAKLSSHFGKNPIEPMAIYFAHANSVESPKALADALIEIDKKTTLFKDGLLPLIGLLAAGKLRFSMLVSLKMLSASEAEMDEMIAEVSKSYDELIKGATDFVTQLKNGVDEDTVKKDLSHLSTFVESLDKMMEIGVRLQKPLDIKDPAAAAVPDDIKEIGHIKEDAVVPQGLRKKYDMLTGHINASTSKVNAIIAEAKAIDLEDKPAVKAAVNEVSKLFGKALKCMAAPVRPIRAAFRYSEVYLQAYRDEAKRIAHQVEVIKKSLDKDK